MAFQAQSYPVRFAPYPVRLINNVHYTLLGILLLAISLMNIVHSQNERKTELSWHTDLESAKKVAANTNKPILIYFTAEWCHYCHKMEDNTLKQVQVASYMREHFTLLRADYDNSKTLVARYRIRGVPATVIGDPKLENSAQISGSMPKDVFLPWIKEAKQAVSPTVVAAKQKAIEAYFTETKRDFRSGLSRQQYESIRQFFQDVREKRPLALEFAENHLVAEVKHNPARFGRFLTDDKLHVRILVTNAFAKIYGSEFTYDPWDLSQESKDQLQSYLKEKDISTLNEGFIDF